MRYGHVELRNDFHGTSIIVRPRYRFYLSEHQVKRIRRALCPVAGCTCSHDSVGTRMQGLYVESHPGGTGCIVFTKLA